MIDRKDKISLKQKKGTWKRTVGLLFKCHLPIFTILVYVAANVGLANVGVDSTDYTAQLFAGDTSAELITKLVMTLLLSLLLTGITTFMREYATAKTNRNARRSLWEKLLRLPMSYFKDEDPEETIARVVNNVSAVSSALTFVIIPLFTTVYGTVISLQRVNKYDSRLALILFCSVPFTILLAFFTGRLKYSASKAGTDVSALLTERLSELIKNIPLTKVFAMEKREEKRGGETVDSLYRVNVKTGWIDRVSELSFTLLGLIETIVIVVVGAMLLRNREINTRAWTTFFLFSGVITGYVDEFVMLWHNSKNIQGVIARVGELMDAEEEAYAGDDAAEMSGDIVIKDVVFGYDETPVLNGFSAGIKKGKITALLGISGCGKTTLINLIDRIYEPDSGSISIVSGEEGEGKNIADYELLSYRRRFSVISQNVMLFSDTLRANLCFGLDKTPSSEELLEVLDKVKMSDYVNSQEEGLDSEIGENGCQLSGGQKQRLALARMLLSDTEYVILDEATASMDAIGVAEMKEVLKEALKTKTVIVIMHTPDLLELADDVIVIEDGKCTVNAPLSEATGNEFLKRFRKEAAHE